MVGNNLLQFSLVAFLLAFLFSHSACSEKTSQNKQQPMSNQSPAALLQKPRACGDENLQGGLVHYVGPTRQIKSPSQAAAIVQDNDMVRIDADLYQGDVAVWTANNLLLCSPGPGFAHLQAQDAIAEDKAIWVIKGDNTIVEGIEFSQAVSSSRNGAGIRHEGKNLLIRSSYFHDNENGLLTNIESSESDILIEYSEFSHNGFGDGLSHNIYVNYARKLIVRYSYIHHANIGHNIKSRAFRNYILYNRIMDENEGKASYQIELPNGGLSYIIGNLIQQGMKNDNDSIISYGAEGITNHNPELYLINNTLSNDFLHHDSSHDVYYYKGRHLNIYERAKVTAINNIFMGVFQLYHTHGQAQLDIRSNLLYTNSLNHFDMPYPYEHNLVVTQDASDKTLQSSPEPVVDRASYDYRLAKDSPARDAGIDPGQAHGFTLLPQFHYTGLDEKRSQRQLVGEIDIGAYEFGGDDSGIFPELENDHLPVLADEDPFYKGRHIIHEWEANLALADVASFSGNNLLQVGLDKAYLKPSDAALVAQDGDLVVIDSGTYAGDVAVWNASNLSIIGKDGFVYLPSNGVVAEDKAIWVIKGDNTRIANIRFAGAMSVDRNGAGIRQEGTNLTISNCYFHDNENGLLAGDNAASVIVIEQSEFARNGYGDGLSHNIYINKIKKFILRFSNSRQAKVGHNVKSRAYRNYILYNRIMDEDIGRASYQIDFPNGGLSFVIGNYIQQGLLNENDNIISYGSEGIIDHNNELYLVHNTISNDFLVHESSHDIYYYKGRHINLYQGAKVSAINNIFMGVYSLYNAIGDVSLDIRSNLLYTNSLNHFDMPYPFNENIVLTEDSGDQTGQASIEPVESRATFDYRLTENSPARDLGIDPGQAYGFPLQSVFLYRNLGPLARISHDVRDIGADEFGGELPFNGLMVEDSHDPQLLPKENIVIKDSYGVIDVYENPLKLADTRKFAPQGSGIVRQVGPGKDYAVPSAAAQNAQDGDLIQIAAGTYEADATVWSANNLTIVGEKGFAYLKSNHVSAEDKAIWVIKGDNTRIANIRFSGAKVADHNGAGIRQEGAGLILSNCYFHDNENGILAAANSNSDIVIEHSEFARNGYGDGLSHNIYINQVRSLTFQFNYSHHALIGHNLKSRAKENYILFNRIMDEQDGQASYQIDLPNGGLSYIVGNIIQQSSFAPNGSLLAYGHEGMSNGSQKIYIVNNTMVNDRHAGNFVSAAVSAQVYSFNNLFWGAGNLYEAELTINEKNNLHTQQEDIFVNKLSADYSLSQESNLAIDKGIAPGLNDGYDLTPKYQYQHKSQKEIRPNDEALDIGATEYSD